jgi:hypothetical protein
MGRFTFREASPTLGMKSDRLCPHLENLEWERSLTRLVLRDLVSWRSPLKDRVKVYIECYLQRETFLEQVAHVETIPWDVPIPSSEEPAWVKSAGTFRDNPAFEDVMKRIQAERDAWGDEEIDVSEYTR